MSLEIINVGGVPGGDAYLVRSEAGSLLVDAGFAFSAPATWENLCAALDEGPAPQVDWLVLTHSHYDHCAGAGYLLAHMPGMRLAASAHAARVFGRPGALATMRELNEAAARSRGMAAFEDVPSDLQVDLVLEDSDVLRAAGRDWRVVATPGHTRCSISLWCEDEGLLVLSETTGVYAGGPEEAAALDALASAEGVCVPAGEDVLGAPAAVAAAAGMLVCPAYLVGYAMSLDALARVRALGPRCLVVPHYGCMEGADVERFLRASGHFGRVVTGLVEAWARAGATDEEICARLKPLLYTDYTRIGQPEEAYDLNTSIMVAMMRRELL